MNKVTCKEYEAVRETVSAWRGRKVLVVGDMMIDEYLYGTTDRVSREAPVVVVRYDDSAWFPGGAANAAANAASLGAVTVAAGIIGADESAKRLSKMLADAGIDTGCLLSYEGRMTTSKTRILAGDLHSQRQQIVRLDRESRAGIEPAIERRLTSRIKSELKGCGAVILSDYGQGVFSGGLAARVVEMASAAGIPTIADSRFGLSRFKGVTTATPNEVEAAEVSGIDPRRDDALERTGRRLLAMLRSDSVLVTRGRLGMALFRRRKKTVCVDVVGSPEATDVTGAGDTVVAAVALSLAAGADMVTAMLAANLAASIVVMKRGTAVTGTGEILARLDSLGKDP